MDTYNQILEKRTEWNEAVHKIAEKYSKENYPDFFKVFRYLFINPEIVKTWLDQLYKGNFPPLRHQSEWYHTVSN